MKSQEIFELAKKVIPGGVSSPVRSFKHVGANPIYFMKGQGAYLTDVEGKSYIDFCLSFGPHILGHCDPEVVAAVQKQATLATSFGACHPKEVELAHLILRGYPFLHKVRLLNSGTEAVMTAIRLARGFTGRPKVLKFEGCYHGHSDGLLAKAGSGVAHLAEADSQGIPSSILQDTVIARYDDLSSIKDAFQQNGGKIAAVIVEPIPANYGLWVPGRDHVKALVEIARAAGALVIFDEVITGFRLGLGGATAYYDLSPDLVTLGKVVGGGLPLAAVVGREDIMALLAPQGSVYQAGTLAGNPLACAAGIATLEKLFRLRPTFNAFDKRCEDFVASLSEILNKKTEFEVRNLGSIFWFRAGKPSKGFPPEISDESKAVFTKLFLKGVEEGLYLPPSPYEVCFLSHAHNDKVLEEALEKFEKCARAL